MTTVPDSLLGKNMANTCASYGGIRRLPYLVGWLALCFLLALAGSWHAGILALVCLVATLILTCYRLQNIGMSQWWALLWLVPIANYFVLVRCLMIPEGFANSRKLDIGAKVFVVLVVGCSLCAVSMVVFDVAHLHA